MGAFTGEAGPHITTFTVDGGREVRWIRPVPAVENEEPAATTRRVQAAYGARHIEPR